MCESECVGWSAVDEEVLARQLAERQRLDDDLDVLSQIMDLSAKLHTAHDVCIHLHSLILHCTSTTTYTFIFNDICVTVTKFVNHQTEATY